MTFSQTIDNLQDFVKNLQGLLKNPINFIEDSHYLDLSITKSLCREKLIERKDLFPSHSPLSEAVCLIIHSMQGCNLSKTKMGINELLKVYLFNITNDNQEECTEVFLGFIYEIYLYSLKDDYPYTDLLWGYLSKCFFPIAMFLIEEGYVEGCKIFLSNVATMGKIAAQKGLHTSNIQEFLHTLELRAHELGYEELGGVAKNHRFNLETF